MQEMAQCPRAEVKLRCRSFVSSFNENCTPLEEQIALLSVSLDLCFCVLSMTAVNYALVCSRSCIPFETFRERARRFERGIFRLLSRTRFFMIEFSTLLNCSTRLPETLKIILAIGSVLNRDTYVFLKHVC